MCNYCVSDFHKNNNNNNEVKIYANWILQRKLGLSILQLKWLKYKFV